MGREGGESGEVVGDGGGGDGAVLGKRVEGCGFRDGVGVGVEVGVL